jgi:dehydrogenase/reductase SDR family protein 12
MSSVRQFISTTQFYLYGRKHFTQTGWKNASKSYTEAIEELATDSLADKVFIVTGANSGVGKEVAQFLASKAAKVYLLCRNPTRALAAKADIIEKCTAQTGNVPSVDVLLCDCSLQSDVKRAVEEFQQKEKVLHGLVCNAGAMSHERTLTHEGVEVTFASHLLFGSYFLTSLLLPQLKAAQSARVIMVTSGGMYTSGFPEWDVATATKDDGKWKYDGQFAYAYAKRAQVLLCERWAKDHPEVKFMTAHPGWTETPAVIEAYGESRKYLAPMRTPWEGAEAMAWMCVTDNSNLESGALYLDRKTQVKHMAGAFFTEGNYTKNTEEEVTTMMQNMEQLANRTPTEADAELAKEVNAVAAAAYAEAKQMELKMQKKEPLQAMKKPIELEKFMGKWYVISCIPTYFEKGVRNSVEEYVWDEKRGIVKVSFRYNKQGSQKESEVKQHAAIVNKETNTEWSLNPKFGVYLPLKLPYLIIDCADDYSYSVIGYPDRAHIWVLSREPTLDRVVYDGILARAEADGYDLETLVEIEHDANNQASVSNEAPSGAAAPPTAPEADATAAAAEVEVESATAKAEPATAATVEPATSTNVESAIATDATAGTAAAAAAAAAETATEAEAATAAKAELATPAAE